MINEKITLYNGVKVPVLGLGTWMIADDKVKEVVLNAFKLGYRHIDTAEAYGNERGVGEAIRESGLKREDYYLETKLDKEAVKDYYNENSFGKINNKHILVKTSDDVTEEQALAVANEIIGRLNQGEDFDTLATEYKEKNTNVVVEDLGEVGAFDNLESSYLEALKTLEKGKYTETPVKTSYGYHVIYCVDKLEKTDEISRKDKMAIIDVLASDIMSADSNLYYKTLIEMRKEAKLKFYDEELKTKYEEYCKSFTDSTNTED